MMRFCNTGTASGPSLNSQIALRHHHPVGMAVRIASKSTYGFPPLGIFVMTGQYRRHIPGGITASR